MDGCIYRKKISAAYERNRDKGGGEKAKKDPEEAAAGQGTAKYVIAEVFGEKRSLLYHLHAFCATMHREARDWDDLFEYFSYVKVKNTLTEIQQRMAGGGK